MTYPARAAQLTAERDHQIPNLCEGLDIPDDPSRLYRNSILTAREVDIVELDATALAQRIASREYTAVEVTAAYIKSAVVAHAATNCLAWFEPDVAMDRARWLDAELTRLGKPVGPMHGVPLSVKDFFGIKGFRSSAGHISSVVTADSDADLVAIFRDAGAVFIAKTTQPQSIMHLETSNFYGTTLNSHNRALTCGGSSGGEGALVGCHGSPMGITTDIGGSTRNPAANNGLWGFKPSSKRVPRDGMIGVTAVARIAGSIGPVCHSRRDMELFYRTVFHSPVWPQDIKLFPLGWREVDADGVGAGRKGWSGTGNKLRVGVMWDDGVVRPVKPIRRAMHNMVDKLRASDKVEVVEFPAQWFAEAWAVTILLYYVDGGKKLDDALEAASEPLQPLTQWIRQQAKSSDLASLEKLISRRNELRQLYYDYFNSHKLDIILSPAGPAPAQPLGTSKYWCYTSMWNLLDWPAAVFPTGLLVEAEDEELDLEPRNEHEAHLYATYSARVAQGSPVGLQVIAPRWQDERLMAALGVLEAVLPLS